MKFLFLFWHLLTLNGLSQRFGLKFLFLFWHLLTLNGLSQRFGLKFLFLFWHLLTLNGLSQRFGLKFLFLFWHLLTLNSLTLNRLLTLRRINLLNDLRRYLIRFLFILIIRFSNRQLCLNRCGVTRRYGGNISGIIARELDLFKLSLQIWHLLFWRRCLLGSTEGTSLPDIGGW